MSRLKTLLSSHYIAAIAIGYLVGRGIEEFVRGLMPFFTAVLAKVFRRVEVPTEYWTTNIPSALINGLLGVILFVAAAVALAFWVFPETLKHQDVPAERESSSE